MRLENATDYVEIDRDEQEITIRSGRLGTRGTSRSFTTKNPAAAVDSYEVAVIEALRDGFKRLPGAKPEVALADPDSPIARALREHRDDKGAREVYADWLQGLGNPTGEYIALALQRGARRDPKIEKRLAALENKLRLPLPDQVKLRWRFGMWTSVRIENQHDRRDGPSGNAAKAPAFHALEIAREVFAHPLCAALDELVLGALGWQNNRTHAPAIVKHAAEYAWARDLPALTVGDCTADPDHPYYMTAYDGGSLGKAISSSFPRLRTLRVWKDLRDGGTTELAGLALPELTDLAIAGRVDQTRAQELAEIKAPNLERLELWIGGQRNEVYVRENRRPQYSIVFSRERYPKLVHLALINSIYTDETVIDLSKAPLAEHLVTLDLTAGTLTDRGAAALASWRERFPRLETVVVDQNILTAAGFAALRGAFKRVVTGTQRPYGPGYSALTQRARRLLT